MNKDIESKIRMLALDLPIGQSTRAVCPICDAKHEQSMTITRQPLGVSYRCFRAKCSRRGFLESVPNTEVYKAEKAFVPHKFSRELSNPTLVLMNYLESRYNIPDKEISKQGWKYVADGHRIYIPIYDLLGHEVGAVTKKLPMNIRPHYVIPSVDDGPKSIVYWFNDTEKLHFPLRDSLTKTVIIVEDSISAIRIAQHRSSAALLGTHMTGKQILFLAQNFERIVFILDPDALTKATALAEKCKLLFKSSMVLPTRADPKDASPEDFKKLMEKIK